MSDWYTNPNVFIRSLASRGSVGGLHPKILEITDLMKAFPFDHLILETVGVGQSEIEIAGLADVTVVVLVPEGGDDVQTMKAGLMEIADIFVINKADRPGAGTLLRNLRQMLAPAFSNHVEEIPVLKTTASEKQGIAELHQAIAHSSSLAKEPSKKFWLLAEKAFHLLEQKRMKGVSRDVLKRLIETAYAKGEFNLYQFLKDK
jgi:LAO/AO transport system kinase